jgi:dihydropteroate synthase
VTHRGSFEERWPRPSVMGILNVTPDSFSDAGLFVESGAAIAHGRRLADEGAALVDVGGESTRPGASAVTADEELSRVVPVLEGLSEIPVSIDTSKAVVARRALELGAELVNDVTALRGDPGMAEVLADADAFVCLMHMQGEPRTMQVAPHYDDVVSDVLAFLEERVAFAVANGIPEERICVDPGIGFGKTADQNLELLRRLDELTSLGRPLLLGVSRKSTFGRILGDAKATQGSLVASIAAAVAAFERGAAMLRAHDVRETVEALAVAAAVERGRITA